MLLIAIAETMLDLSAADVTSTGVAGEPSACDAHGGDAVDGAAGRGDVAAEQLDRRFRGTPVDGSDVAVVSGGEDDVGCHRREGECAVRHGGRLRVCDEDVGREAI